ncbi:MAG: DUF4145 domain-containing protein [Alphaproteobacteria bacterium]|nr:DUF4145 domain-containing protein [Alphaproteobacteria bacterium]
MSGSFPWTCPYCNRDTLIVYPQYSNERHDFNCNNKYGNLGIYTKVIVCPNSHCKECVITAALYRIQGNVRDSNPLLEWQLKPQSSAKPYPDYIPEPIRKDYEEACLIRDLSPKASATLSRRCMQGIIRNFWCVSKNTLFEEINAIKDEVDLQTWKAIDSVRGVGNIGAHMEKDINIIVDVEPEEAGLLIRLVEDLFQEWYINRHEREERSKALIFVAESKKEQRKNTKKAKTTEE